MSIPNFSKILMITLVIFSSAFEIECHIIGSRVGVYILCFLSPVGYK